MRSRGSHDRCSGAKVIGWLVGQLMVQLIGSGLVVVTMGPRPSRIFQASVWVRWRGIGFLLVMLRGHWSRLIAG